MRKILDHFNGFNWCTTHMAHPFNERSIYLSGSPFPSTFYGLMRLLHSNTKFLRKLSICKNSAYTLETWGNK